MSNKTMYEMLEELQSVLPKSERRSDLKEVAEFIEENKDKSILQLVSGFPDRYPQFQIKQNQRNEEFISSFEEKIFSAYLIIKALDLEDINTIYQIDMDIKKKGKPYVKFEGVVKKQEKLTNEQDPDKIIKQEPFYGTELDIEFNSTDELIKGFLKVHQSILELVGGMLFIEIVGSDETTKMYNDLLNHYK